jgi:hypothetical protein
VARPEYISALHEAKYELRFCNGGRKVELLKAYQEALATDSREAQIPEALLEAAVAKDFGAWIKQEKLPRLPDSK